MALVRFRARGGELFRYGWALWACIALGFAGAGGCVRSGFDAGRDDVASSQDVSGTDGSASGEETDGSASGEETDGSASGEGTDLGPGSTATGLTWAETSPVFQRTVHARWTPAMGPKVDYERVELHRDSGTCQDAVGGWVRVSSPGSFEFTVEAGHLYSYRVETHDRAGHVAKSHCSPQIDVRRFDWTTVGPRYWPELQRRLKATIAQGVTGSVTVRQIPNATFAALPSGRYQGAILVPQGHIYGIPRLCPQLGELSFPATGDPTGTVVGLSLGGEDTWYGAALARDGRVYSPPSDIPYVLRMDPADVAHAGTITGVNLGKGQVDENKWQGLRLAANGLLIACPRNDRYVLAIDPKDLSSTGIRRVGPDLGPGEKWHGGVLAPNGKIYCIPSRATQILEIDPDDLTATGIRRVGPDLGTGDDKWWGGALGANGKIYAAPHDDPRVLEIAPDAVTASGRVGPDLGSGKRKWTWGSLAANGKIYAVPGDRDKVLEIDPADLSSSGIHEVGPSVKGNQALGYFAAVAAPNGKLYALPWYGASDILEIDPHARGRLSLDVLLNGHLNGQ